MVIHLEESIIFRLTKKKDTLLDRNVEVYQLKKRCRECLKLCLMSSYWYLCTGQIETSTFPPAHLTPIPVLGEGNLIVLVFPGAGHLITTHRGWGIWSLASISCHQRSSESLLMQNTFWGLVALKRFEFFWSLQFIENRYRNHRFPILQFNA